MPADVCLFGYFWRCSPAAVHLPDCPFDFAVKWLVHVSSIVRYLCKNSFWFCWYRCKQRFESSTVVFDQLWANTVPTLKSAFSSTNVHAKWWIHYLLISSTPLLSQAISIYNRPKRCLRIFCIFRDNCLIWATLALSLICVSPTAFKVSAPPLNRCFWENQVRITLIKPMLCLNNIFYNQKAMLYQHTKLFFVCFSSILRIYDSSFF